MRLVKHAGTYRGDIPIQPLPLAESLPLYRDHFPGPHLDLVLASMLAGNTAGELWIASEGDEPSLLLLWDRGNNNLYLSGAGARESSLASLATAIAADIRPRALTQGVTRFKTRALSPALEPHLHALFPWTELRETITLFLVHDAARPLPPAHVHVPGMELVPITQELLASAGVAHTDAIRAEIRAMWPSEERFHEHGFGVLAVVGDEIIGWCTAEYASPGLCGIGIETSPRFQGRGVATATASRFVQDAHKRGVTACWECALTNLPSVRVAEKVRFLRQTEEIYRLGSFEGHGT